MKVVFTIDSLLQGGTEQSIAGLIPYFSKEIQVTVVYFYPKHDLLPLFEATCCNVVFLDLKGKYDWRNGVKRLYRLLKQERPDMVVSSLYRANLISRLVCARMKIPLIGTFVEDSYSADRKQTFRGIRRLKYHLTYLADRLTSGIPVKWIANSQTIQKTNGKKLSISEHKIKVVYRGRDTRVFDLWRESTDKSVFRFATIGRLFEKKGYPELLDAFTEVHKEYPHTTLTIYGEGPLRREIEQRLGALQLQDAVFLKGKVPSAWKSLHEADCFVFPSRFEGFSGTLVEAMLLGIPIICSDIPMNLEAVTPDETALVHKVQDAKDLVSKMREMIVNYASMIQMGEKSRNRAMEYYDIRKIAYSYEEVLKSAALNQRQ